MINEWEQRWEELDRLVNFYGILTDEQQKIKIQNQIILELKPIIKYQTYLLWNKGFRYQQNPDKYVSFKNFDTILPYGEAVYTHKDLENDIVIFILQEILPKYKTHNTFKNNFEIYFGYKMMFFVPDEIKELVKRLMQQDILDLDTLPRQDIVEYDIVKFRNFKYHIQEHSNIENKVFALKIVRHICFSPVDTVFYQGRFCVKRLKENYFKEISIDEINDMIDLLKQNKELKEYCSELAGNRHSAHRISHKADYYNEYDPETMSKVDYETALWYRGQLKWKGKPL